MAMDYDEIITQYKNGSIDISDLKKKLEIARPLNARSGRLDFRLIGSTFSTIREGVNAQLINEKPERVQEYKSIVDYSLLNYFTNIVSRIDSSRAWGIMKIVPTKITKEDFKELSTDEKLKFVMTLNQRYNNFLKIQKYADLRECIINDGDLLDENIKKMQFILLMFEALKSKTAKEDFFCIPEELLSALMSFRRSKHKKLEDYFASKSKFVKQSYENYSQYCTTEEFRDIIENLQLVSKTLKISVSKVIEYYSAISWANFEIRGLDDEYDIFMELSEKNKKMFSLVEKTEEPKVQKHFVEVEEKPEINTKVKNELKKEPLDRNTGVTGQIEKQITENNSVVSVKEQIIPLILAWFGTENKELAEITDAKKISNFLEKLKQIESYCGARVGLYIVTNASKEITLKRMQELEHKARAKGMGKLIEGALGGYSSFRIDKSAKITDLSIMEEETREKIIQLLGMSMYDRGFVRELIDPRENNYIRYFFSIKKDSSIDLKYLKFRISSLLKDPNVKKQPLSFVPFIEGECSGVDVLLKSQLDGLDNLSEYLKSKYTFYSGKTMKANIYALDKFAEEKEKIK